MVINAFLSALFSVLFMLIDLYVWIVIIRALITWVNADPYNPIVRLLSQLVDPITGRIRRWFPFVRVGMVDLSPLLLVFFLYFVKVFLVSLLHNMQIM